MSKIEVYGFGSFFNGSNEYCDIDLLLIHEDRSKQSCINTINCKRELQALLKNLDVTMLSKDSEREFSFKSKSQAKYIGHIDMLTKNRDAITIAGLIEAHSKNRTAINN